MDNENTTDQTSPPVLHHTLNANACVPGNAVARECAMIVRWPYIEQPVVIECRRGDCRIPLLAQELGVYVNGVRVASVNPQVYGDPEGKGKAYPSDVGRVDMEEGEAVNA